MTMVQKGVYHNLHFLFHEINGKYFQNQIVASVRWGVFHPEQSRKRQSILLGSYRYDQKLITLHPALDQAFIPSICIARVLHHEMLHQKHYPPRSRKRKQVHHSKQFLWEEGLFEGARTADQWFKQNLHRLLAYRPFTTF